MNGNGDSDLNGVETIAVDGVVFLMLPVVATV